MISRKRVLTALNLAVPDKVPYIEIGVDEDIGKKMLDRELPVYNEDFDHPGFGETIGFNGWNYFNPAELCEVLQLDGWGYTIAAPLYSNEEIANLKEGERKYQTGGKIKNIDDLKKMKLANLKDNQIFEKINNYINKYKGDYSVYAVTNMGTDPMLLSLGWETFSYSLIDNIKMIEELLDIYNEWIIELVKRLCELDLDFIWFGDDIAYKNGLMFSPDFYREICIPRLKKVADTCTKPFIYHSDGNYLEVVEDLLSLGINGLHPFEPVAIDIFDFKEKYGNRVCIVGNIDIDTLSRGSETEVYNEVANKLKVLSGGGGYIMSSSNTLTCYSKIKNVKAMIKSFNKFR